MAESFGTDPERYDRARPPYPAELIDRIAADEILDVGCGTGIEARQLQAAGCTVLGVEPDPRMAGFARNTGVPVEVATFEDWEPAGRDFDGVVAGQSWHWVDPVAGPVKAAQVLRPGGRLTVFAHVIEAPGAVGRAFAEAYRRVVPASPFPMSGTRSALDLYQTGFARFADTIRETGPFQEPEQWRFDWDRPYTREEWLDLLPTTGGLTRLPAEKLAQILDAVGAAIDGSFTMKYVTLAVSAVRVSPAEPARR
jgi:SAM-dependent methyltransferase